MIWIKKNKEGENKYYTSDNKSFNTIKDATKYASINIDNLITKNETYDLLINRKKKIEKIKNRLFN